MNEQLELAHNLGRLGYLSGRKAPAQDEAVVALLRGRKVGETPEGQAPTLKILDEWNKGFAEEHLSAVGLSGGTA